MALWAALFLLHLAPVWLLHWFPTQDGPSHVENANILLELREPGATVFRRFYEVNSRPNPNWLGHLLLAGLIAATNPFVAEKLLLSAYIVLVPLAARYVCQKIRPGSAPIALLSFPLLFNCLLHYGFYNFCLSIPLFLATIGMWLRRRSVAPAAALLLLLYGSHVVSWGLAILALLLVAPRDWRRLALAAAPSIALAMLFFGAREIAGRGLTVGLGARWYGLWHFTTSVFSYDATAQWTGAALALFLAGTAAAAVRYVARGYVLFSGALLVLYLGLPPEAFGGAQLLERLNLYFFLSLLLWIAARPWSPGWTRLLQATAALFSIAMLALNWPWYRAANRLEAEYLSAAPFVRPNTAFVPLVYDPRGLGPLRALYGEPMRHVAGYISATRRAVNLDNYEAQSDLFPVKFHADRNPAVFVGAMEENPPRVRLDSPLIDSVLVWDPARSAPPPAGFVLAFTSQQGNVRVWHRP